MCCPVSPYHFARSLNNLSNSRTNDSQPCRGRRVEDFQKGLPSCPILGNRGGGKKMGCAQYISGGNSHTNSKSNRWMATQVRPCRGSPSRSAPRTPPRG